MSMLLCHERGDFRNEIKGALSLVSKVRKYCEIFVEIYSDWWSKSFWLILLLFHIYTITHEHLFLKFFFGHIYKKCLKIELTEQKNILILEVYLNL